MTDETPSRSTEQEPVIRPIVARRVRPIGVESSSSEYCESMGSWLLRTANANGFLKLSDLMQKTGYYNVHLDIPRNPHKYIPALSSATGRPRDEIEPMLLSTNEKGEVIKRDFSARIWLLSAWRPQTPTRDGMRHVACAFCLHEDSVPYWRKYWRFSFTTTCLVHQTAMLDCCRHCCAPFVIDAWDCFDPSRCSACGRQISEPKPASAALRPARLERMLSSVFSTGGPSALLGVKPTRTHHLNLQRLVHFLCAPEGLLYRGVEKDPRSPFERKTFGRGVLVMRFPGLPIEERRAVMVFVERMARRTPVALWLLLNLEAENASAWSALARLVVYQCPRPMRWARSSSVAVHPPKESHAAVEP